MKNIWQLPKSTVKTAKGERLKSGKERQRDDMKHFLKGSLPNKLKYGRKPHKV